MISEELQKISSVVQSEEDRFEHELVVCKGTACISAHSEQVEEALKSALAERGLQNQCRIKGVGCHGLCAAAAVVSVHPENRLYKSVQPDDAADIIASIGSKPVERLAIPTQVPFFQRQKKLVLENSGRIDPEEINDYVGHGGYNSLINVLTEMTPAEVITEITRSGLRGRGGAGYLTGLKWSTVSKSGGAHKFVICNGDEGDPGAFMDRSVMESDPHRIIEGMAIAAYAVGADQGYIYVRAEYPLAVKRLQAAIRQGSKLGVLGNNIAGTTFSFNIEVRLGAGAFVCGEETALMASIEGRRGTPRPRPPYPAEHGLWGYPTLLNNVETFANVPVIIREGSEAFAQIGTEKSKGTKVFALTGCVKNSGLIEVPMGITLREIVYDIGGGIPNDRPFKALQTGGPSGGCIPKDYLDTPIDYESLMQLGSIMGSGGMIVMDDTSCMVDVAKYFMKFSMLESCGKCIPCRVGTTQMYNLLDKISMGKAALEDLALLEELCDMVKRTSLCGLGQSAPNPVLSTLRFFRDEYLLHVVEKVCPAGVCKLHHEEVKHA
jgi:bidirectional [NiFe] hydrogenase diaphorase subunit